MFPVSMDKLRAEDGAPFPLFLFLERNQKFIPIRQPGDPIGMRTYELFLKKHSQLWVPNNFQEIYQTYLQFVESNAPPAEKAADAAAAAAAASAPAGASVAPPDPPRSEEAKVVSDVLIDEDLSSEEKAEVLSAVSQDVMRALNQITTRGKEARAEGLKRCKEIADEVLTIAAKNSNIYDEILALRNSQEEIEHSVLVGTMAAMFGMAIGYTDERLLSDLTVGAIFHDIGLVRVNPDVVAKKEVSWTPEERKLYETHVDSSLEILKESGSDFHPRVFRMISEHHENYDGSGFPKGLKGGAIDEASAILHLANWFDRLCTGKHTGGELAPAEAFKFIHEANETSQGKQEVQPELVERVFQFMLTEKTAADEMKKAAEARALDAMKNNLGG
ncbi:MAG TPA: HD domain-containing phosphohydrolase [Bdellovibrionota bacterium]